MNARRTNSSRRRNALYALIVFVLNAFAISCSLPDLHGLFGPNEYGPAADSGADAVSEAGLADGTEDVSVADTVDVSIDAEPDVVMLDATTIDANTDASMDVSGDTNACAHDKCGAGVALDATCDPCVTAVCAVLPQCCAQDGAWDVSCLNQIERTCGDGGNSTESFAYCGKAGTCEHDLCATGTPLTGGVSAACDLCVYVVCSKYPSCCTAGWTRPCTDQAQLICAITCP